MKKSVKVRKIIFDILIEIYNKSINFDESYKNFTEDIPINNQEKSIRRAPEACACETSLSPQSFQEVFYILSPSNPLLPSISHVLQSS